VDPADRLAGRLSVRKKAAERGSSLKKQILQLLPTMGAGVGAQKSTGIPIVEISVA